MGSEEVAERVDEQKSFVSLLQEDLDSPSKPSPTGQEDAADHGDEKIARNCKDMDSALARVELEKRVALIKAWEDNEKTKVDNRAYKMFSAIDAWENTKRAYVDARLKQIEGKFEKKKAEYGEKMKNKMAIIHRTAEEKRAIVEAVMEHDVLAVEEASAMFRANGRVPKKFFSCFRC